MEEVKQCFKCGRIKPLSEFYAHKQMRDGHLNKCKECTKREIRERRASHPDRELDTRLSACARKPTRKNAYMAVDAAIRAGVISRPDRCMGCGCPDTEHRVEAHHSDYSKPLEVIWLCTPCHRAMDARRRAHEERQ